MKRWILLAIEFCKKKWLLVTCLIVLLFALAGIGPAYAAIHRAQQPQKQQGYHQQDDINAEDESDQEETTLSHLSSTGSCGVERWSVKTGTDANSGLINLQSTTQTTIASLSSLPAPSSLPDNNRIQPTETTVFQLHDTLTEYKLETDSDYHMVLQDASGKTMITEIPDPVCVGSSSPLLAGIQKARSEFNARYTPTSSFKTANVPVTVTGIGFFDFLHGQTGVTPNGIELHAVIDIQFGTGGTPTPTPTPTSKPTPTPTGNPTPTPTPTGTPPITTNLILNGGFEPSGSWTYAGQNPPARTTAMAHSGSYSLKVGLSSGQQGDSIAYQGVTIPASTTSATLSFFYWPATTDSITYSWQEADVISSSGQVIQQLFRKDTNDRTWIPLTFDLSKYAGQTIGIQFLDHELSNSGTYYSYMYVDDVVLTVH